MAMASSVLFCTLSAPMIVCEAAKSSANAAPAASVARPAPVMKRGAREKKASANRPPRASVTSAEKQ
jgi:hypothetical protein